MSAPCHKRSRDKRSGFALVAVITLMVLLVVIGMGILSLSAVNLRNGGRQSARAEARANARMAVLLALGQLQRDTGVDTCITGPADFLEPAAPADLAHPGWRGVWHSSSVEPRSYEPARADSFSGWLVSESGQRLPLEAAREPLSGEAVVMRRSDDQPELRVPLIAAPDKGRLAWWTDDESLKARADLAPVEPSSMGDAAVAAHAAARPVPEAVPGFTGFTPTLENSAGLVTPRQLELASADQWPDRQGAHFTTFSRSVLADVRDGGLKRDLSSLFEQDAGRITEFGLWTGSRSLNSAKAYLYGPPAGAMGARWNHLHAYYNLYKDVTFEGDEPRVEPHSGLIDWHLADQYQDFGDEAGGFRFPRLAKIIYVFSYSATRNSGPATRIPPSRKPPQESYTLQMVTDIFVTLWNPFDVRINFPLNTTFFAKFSKGLPLRFDWRINDVSKGEADVSEIIPTSGFLTQSQFLNPYQGRRFSMGPGETLVFSIKKDSDNQFWPGVFYDGGVASDTLLAGGRKITGGAGDQVSVGLKPAQNSLGYTADGQGNSQYLDFWIYDTVRRWPYYEHRGEILARADAPFLRQMRPVEASEVPSVKLSSVVGRKQPFGAFIMETKTALDSKVPVPAFLNSGITRLSSRLTGDPGEFANERLEYKVEPVTGFDSDIIQVTLPRHPAGPNHGFIGSGRGPATGQTHFLFSAIPTVMPTSLAQFRHAGVGDGASTLRATHWNFNSTPNPPFADQAIGNSYAHPLVPPRTTAKGSLLDHRSLGNQALWDGFFLSSLAPRDAARFGREETMWQAWRSFLDGESRLPNRRFSPWLGEGSREAAYDRCFGGDDDAALRPDAYQRIAASLLLEGGFNVNSTSVPAWRAMLSSTRGRTLTRLPLSGETKGRQLSGSGAVYSRTGAVLADSVDSGGDGLASHYGGFRDLSEEQVGRLAEAIVEQVRKRGPFLNMAEFINRRPGGDPQLGLSGALQTAIDSCGLNEAVAAGGQSGSATPGGARMAFPAASTLSTAAGNTGWLMQGDLLDPLGPSLVARGDTFRVRGYGEARSAQGRVTARAWCEVVVQRLPDYLDAAESADVAVPKKPLNLRFGRRYRTVSFRWISGPEE